MGRLPERHDDARRLAYFGGTIAAPIWHDFMTVAKGDYCGDWPAPKEPFEGAPFFGTYAELGRRLSARTTATDDTTDEDDDHARARRRRRTTATNPNPDALRTSAAADARADRLPPARARAAARRPDRLIRADALIAGTVPRVPKEEKVELEGEVIEALPNAMFRVRLDNDHVVLGHVAGKMRRFRIRILPGDRVRCELSPYDLDRARIVYRHR